MNIHEFQGKSLLKQYHIPVQEGVVIGKDSNVFETNKLKDTETVEESELFHKSLQLKIKDGPCFDDLPNTHM